MCIGYFVHCVVCNAFHMEDDLDQVVEFVDGNKFHTSADNLRFVQSSVDTDDRGLMASN